MGIDHHGRKTAGSKGLTLAPNRSQRGEAEHASEQEGHQAA
jgi:hypothetical protein